MTNSMATDSVRETEFAVFGIENTAKRLGIDGNDIVEELNKTNGIEEFLFPSYPQLHTQSKDYIVDEILMYIRRHNPNFPEKKER
jgi:hypothetical protein